MPQKIVDSGHCTTKLPSGEEERQQEELAWHLSHPGSSSTESPEEALVFVSTTPLPPGRISFPHRLPYALDIPFTSQIFVECFHMLAHS